MVSTAVLITGGVPLALAGCGASYKFILKPKIQQRDNERQKALNEAQKAQELAENAQDHAQDLEVLLVNGDNSAREGVLIEVQQGIEELREGQQEIQGAVHINSTIVDDVRRVLNREHDVDIPGRDDREYRGSDEDD